MARVVHLPEPDPSAAIEAALRRLPVASTISAVDRDAHIKSASDILLRLYAAHQRQPETPEAFRHRGQIRAKKALTAVAAAGVKFADAIGALPAEAIVALADLPPGENWLRPARLENIARIAAGACRRAAENVAPTPRKPNRVICMPAPSPAMPSASSRC
jgi:hypothetical protein